MILEKMSRDYGVDRNIWAGKIISNVIELRWGVKLKKTRIYEFLNELNLIVLSMKEYGVETSIRFSLLTGSQVLDKQRQPLVDKIMQMVRNFEQYPVSNLMQLLAKVKTNS